MVESGRVLGISRYGIKKCLGMFLESKGPKLDWFWGCEEEGGVFSANEVEARKEALDDYNM